MNDTPGGGLSQPITFRVVAAPAGWKIIGAEGVPMSTLYLSRKLAAEHAQEMVDVLRGYGQQAQVIVDGECPAD